MMTTHPMPAELRGIPIFAGLDDRQLSVVATSLTEENYPLGRSVVREGEIGYVFYVIKEGSADVTRGTEVLRRLGRGDFFGEVGIGSSDGKRTATVTARTNLVVWSVLGTSLRQMEKSHPEIATQLQAALHDRKSGQ